MKEQTGVKNWFKGESKEKMHTHTHTHAHTSHKRTHLTHTHTHMHTRTHHTHAHTHTMKNAEINLLKVQNYFLPRGLVGGINCTSSR